MVDPAALKYVKDLLRQGYPSDFVRDQLRRANYPTYEIDRLLKAATGFSYKGPILIIIIGVLVLSLVTGVLVYIASLPPVITLEVLPLASSLEVGESLEFEALAHSGEEYPVKLQYELLSAADKRVGYSSDRVDAPVQKQVTMRTQGLEPGEYSLVVTMSYADEEVVSEETIILTAPPNLTPSVTLPSEEQQVALTECPSGCDDFNACTQDYCEDGVCRHDPIRPCCGNGQCEEGESVVGCPEDCRAVERPAPEAEFTQAVELAETDPDEAADLCSNLPAPEDFDQCFMEISLAAGDSKLCNPILEPSTRDSCYINFIYEGEMGVCDKIAEPLIQLSCYNIRNLQEYA